jgi:uncharacterized membrane protein HdeD (DUF308 family)
MEQSLVNNDEHVTVKVRGSQMSHTWNFLFAICVLLVNFAVVVLFVLAIALSVLQFTDSDCPFAIYYVECQSK